MHTINFTCYKKRKGCHRKLRYEIKKKNWFIISKCDSSVVHDSCIFDFFYENFQKKNLEIFNMAYKIMQQYLIRSLFKSNQVTDSNLIKSIFKREFNIPLILNMSEIIEQKFIGIGETKNQIC